MGPPPCVRVDARENEKQESTSIVIEEHLRLLLSVQEVDEAIAEARVKQKRLPEKVATERAGFEEAEARLNEAKEAIDGHEKVKREKEAELSEHEEHLKRLKSHLKEITNTREYQAYIQEMDGIQRNVGKLEEEILDILAEIETVGESMDALTAGFEEHRGVYEAERAKVDVDLAKLEKEIKANTALKEKRCGQVDTTLMRRYERIAMSMRRPVVPVQAGGCTGCNMSVPPQLVSEVKRGKGVHQCPHCHRLLYVPEVPAESAAK